MKRVLEGPVVVLPRDHNTIDVFTGMGWDKHTVFKVYKGHPKMVSGESLSEEDFKTLKKLLS